MSIHVTLSPEAQARLNTQQRTSTISSVIIAILSIVVVALVLSVFLLPSILKDPDVIITYDPPKTEDPPDNSPPVSNPLLRKPTPPAASAAQTRVIAAQTVSIISIPVPEVVVMAPSANFGDGDDFGPGGFGEGINGGPRFEGIRSGLRARCSPAERMARLLSEGGTEQCEDGVVKALDWLQATQNPDGSWTKDHPVAMTGFALLAFLGHCETPQSPKYGETVLKGITYLVDLGMKNDSRLSNKDANSIQWVYDHGIATYALSESYTFCNQLRIPIPNLDIVTKKALEMIMDGQTAEGSWVYKFSGSGGDNSVGFWQIQAMKAGKHTGLIGEAKFKKPSRKALEWLEKVQGADGAIGYRSDPKQSSGLTGGGVLAFQMWGEEKSKPVKKGIEWIEDNSEFAWPSANLYYHYYNAQAMINAGGKEWEAYNLRFRDALLKGQKPDGSWDKGGGGNHGAANIHMATCLATMMLEVYYRFLPGTGEK